MSFLGRLLGYLSVLANLALGLILLGMGFIGSMAGGDMKIDLIPVAPESMATTLMVSGLVALIAVVMALRPGKGSRTLLVLWSLLVAAMPICALTRSSYRFDGEEHFRAGVWVFLGTLLLLLGAILHRKYAPAARRRD
jgi:predicted membrane channel-forming protein YqfA (hemolysin III family)